MLFLNDLAEGIQGYLDENSLNVDFSICFFAYHQSQAAPVKTDENGNVAEEKVGGLNCYQMVGIYYFNSIDGARLSEDIKNAFSAPGGKERYWETVPNCYVRKNGAANSPERSELAA